MRYYIVLGIVLTCMLFAIGWHNIDSAYNFKRMNLFLEEKNINYEILDSGLVFSKMSSEQGHMSGMMLIFLAFFSLITVVIIDDYNKEKKLGRIKLA